MLTVLAFLKNPTPEYIFHPLKSPCFPNNPSVHGALRLVFLAWRQAHSKVFGIIIYFFTIFVGLEKGRSKDMQYNVSVTMKRGVESGSAAYATRNLYVKLAFKII